MQYGLGALVDRKITPAEFLHLNATVGSRKDSKDMVQEGCPFLSLLCSNPAQFDPWSRRNMRLSPDAGVTRPRAGRATRSRWRPRTARGTCSAATSTSR